MTPESREVWLKDCVNDMVACLKAAREAWEKAGVQMCLESVTAYAILAVELYREMRE